MWTCSESTVRFFFRFCQLAGFLPFRIVIDSRTGLFTKFSHSWRYSVTWWSVLMAIINYLSHFPLLIVLYEQVSLNSSPAIVHATQMTVGGFSFLVFTSSRFWLTFHLSTLNKAIRHMQKAEIALSDVKFKLNTTLDLRVAAGSVGILIWVRIDQLILFQIKI